VKLHHPVSYSVADHAAKVFRSDEYKRAAASLGLRAEDFQADVAAELKAAVAEQHAEELRAYEKILGARALAAAVEKAKARKAA
jgi:hypothetical protein